ncbi:MAG: hypothetical protein K9L57_09645 [Spirochaetaceae bacterium]|nr:hypothetical protein [Spirochaetia bacterium]MCF7951884.1 hypothetical protein [Spirochaetaceae bacterium]
MKTSELQKTTNPAEPFYRGCKTDQEKFEKIANFAADFICWLYEEDERMKKIEEQFKELRRGPA